MTSAVDIILAHHEVVPVEPPPETNSIEPEVPVVTDFGNGVRGSVPDSGDPAAEHALLIAALTRGGTT
ncbi:MAG: hypothetical protein H0T69_02415 [Thermoleophilaceae bacterium]|nr:hypothetical protein [Thermoleophilaceae bacterium]